MSIAFYFPYFWDFLVIKKVIFVFIFYFYDNLHSVFIYYFPRCKWGQLLLFCPPHCSVYPSFIFISLFTLHASIYPLITSNHFFPQSTSYLHSIYILFLYYFVSLTVQFSLFFLNIILYSFIVLFNILHTTPLTFLFLLFYYIFFLNIIQFQTISNISEFTRYIFIQF